ncbi:MAG: hypothetical protein JWN44_1123 [Myxococcales bacterium]|nr:hypothetical protein [Myxococcales bacterium]
MKRAVLVAMMATAAAAVGAGTAAHAEDATPLPPVGEVVQKARAVMDKKPERVVCQVRIETQLLDKAGKLEHQEEREAKATFDGDKQDLESTRVVRDGKALTADELKSERDKAKKQHDKSKKSDDDDFDLSPLAAKNAPQEQFELLRKETLWGRPTFVLKVKANKAASTLANGTIWVDAEKFIELKGDLQPAAMPPHADWVKVQEQYVMGPKDVPMPSFVHIEGGGHFLFMRKTFKTTLRWSDCR